VARRAIDRTLAAFFVATLALLMKGIGPQGAHSFTFLCLMAISAARRLFSLLLDLVMALRTLEAVSLVPGVLLVIKEDVPRDVFEHQSNRLLGGFGRIGRITDRRNEKKNACHHIRYSFLFL